MPRGGYPKLRNGVLGGNVPKRAKTSFHQKLEKNPSQASRDHGKPLAFLEGLFASGGWGYPPDPLEMGREADSCGC